MENISEMIETLRPGIEQELSKQMAKSVAEALSWSLKSEVEKFANAYIQENVLPDVKKQLESSRDEITIAICAAVKKSCAALGDKLLENALKKLSQSYTVGKIAKDLFD